jgi:hypothetical protein
MLNRYITTVPARRVLASTLGSRRLQSAMSGSSPGQDEHATTAAKTTSDAPSQNGDSSKAARQKKPTMAELDAEMMARMEERSGDGGAAGLELEDGKAPAMKRGGTWSYAWSHRDSSNGVLFSP